MTAPTSPGVVPADVLALATTFANELRAANTLYGVEHRIARAIIADRANRPSLTEDERIRELEFERDAYKAALTPSAATRALLIGEFFEEIEVRNPDYEGESDDPDEDEEPEFIAHRVPVTWTTTKVMMEFMRRHAEGMIAERRTLADRSEPRQEKEGDRG